MMNGLRLTAIDLHRLQQIIASLSEGVILVNREQSLVWANDAALHMHGVEEMSGLGDDIDGYRSRFQLRYRNNHRLEKGNYPLDRVIAGEAFTDVVVEVFPEGEGERRWVHRIRSLILPADDGTPDLLVLVLEDATAQIEAEERFEQTFNVNPAPAVVLRLSDLRYVKVNQGFLDLTGYAREEVLDRTLYDVDVLQDAAEIENAKERLREGLTIRQMQADLTLPDGGRKLVIVAGQPIDLQDEPCMLFSFADLEPRRQAENELRHSEERFVTTFRLAPVAMAITTADEQTLCDTNDAFHQLSGWSSDEAMGKTLAAMQLWDGAAFLNEVDGLLNERSGFRGKDARVRMKDGGFIDCLVSAETINLRSDTCILWVIQDIHERRHNELELITALEEVMKDTTWFSRTVIEKLANLRAPEGSTQPLTISELTRREKDVLSLICEGGDDALIARELGVSRNTLRNHVARIYAKIGVNRRAQAILWARERGFPLARANR